MDVDLSQFYEVFFDEADEHLANVEATLLSLDLAQPDPDRLNEIFRAAHSIKGGAGTFGFKEMTEVTHELETLLDEVRKGKRPMTLEIVDVALAWGDCCKQMLGNYRAGAPADPDSGRDIVVRVRQIAQNQSSATAEQASSPPVAAPAASAASVEQRDGYRLKVPLTGDIDWFGVLGRIGSFSGANIVSFPLEAGDTQPLVIDCFGPRSLAEELVDALGFLLPPELISIMPLLLPQDEHFGLFEEPVAPVEAFGLFDDEQPAKPAETAFGLFDDAPGLAPVKAAPVADEGFGLFDDTPLPPPVAAKPAPRETKAAEAKGGDAKTGESSSIRVGVEKVDQLLNLVGELVITQSMLAQCGQALDPIAHEKLLGGIELLERNTRELQESVMSIRMLPISAVFNRFPRLVRDLATTLGKKIELKLIGENTELDKGFIEKLSDPLTHLVRNSLDHGIEASDVRRAAGKPETGTLTLRAFHQGGSIVIQVSDDGGGLNREKILAKARERGMTVSDAMADGDVFALIFEAGFSTAAQVTDVSGRGVGMDVVRRNIQQMGGRIDIESMLGVGTTMTLRLPLTLAILDGMSVSVGAEVYIVPLSFIAESLQPQASEIKGVAGQGRLLRVRGEYLPLMSLADLFEVPGARALESGLCIVLEADGERVALLVDDLLGQQQVVIKNLEKNYRKVAGISGATIMGDGRVALIIDVPAMIRLARQQHPSRTSEVV